MKGAMIHSSPIPQKPRLHLRDKDSLGKDLGTIAARQLKAAIAELSGNNVSPEPVHNARTYIKKVRAIVHLASPALGSIRRDQLLKRLHDAATRLSPLRDSEVQVESLDNLLESIPLDSAQYSGIRAGLADIAKQRRINGARQIPRVIASLKQVLGSIPDWPVRHIEGSDLRRRIRRTYRRGRTTLDLCAVNKDADLFHTWRKLLKQLWYSIRITAPFWPAEGAALVAELKTLGECAGLERDYTLLLETLRQGPKNKLSARLISAIEEQLPILRSETISKGLRLYERKPKQFVEKLEL
jgi:CHAD domain-containing protein